MIKYFKRTLFALFMVLMAFFVIRWSLHGSDYVFNFKAELENISNSILNPSRIYIEQFRSFSLTGNFGTDSLSILKVIGSTFLLPIQVLGGLFIWLFS